MTEQLSYRMARNLPQADLLVAESASSGVVLHLRSRNRNLLTRTFVWKKRHPVLLCHLSVLLLYETSADDACPSLILNIDKNLRVDTVDGHPTHLNIRYIVVPEQSSSSSPNEQQQRRSNNNNNRNSTVVVTTSEQPSYNNNNNYYYYSGSDHPKLIVVEDEDDNQQEIIHASWRIRFSTLQIAQQWKWALEALVQTAMDRTNTTTSSTDNDDDRPSNNQEDTAAEAAHRAITFFNPPRPSSSSSSSSSSRRYWTLAILIWIVLILGKRQFQQQKQQQPRSTATMTAPADRSSSNGPPIHGKDDDQHNTKPIISVTSPMEEEMVPPTLHSKNVSSEHTTTPGKQEERQRRQLLLLDLVFDRIVPTLQQWILYTIRPSPSTQQSSLLPPPLPETRSTHLRQILHWRKACFQEGTGLFPPDSFFYDYYFLLAPALLVFLLSMLSLLSRIIPWRIQVAIMCLGIAVLLLEDTYTNHWMHPLHYGLYWKGYGQMGAVLLCLFEAFIQVRKFRGWRPPNPPRVSHRRQVASALAAALGSSALPLSLRAIAEPSIPSSVRFWVAAAFVLFTGVHFFGWARRDLVVAGIPVGEHIYQTSLIPANAAVAVLRILEDWCRYSLERSYRACTIVANIVGPILCNAWNRYQATIDAILSLLFDRMIPFATKQCLSALDAIVFIGRGIWKNLFQPIISRVRPILFALWKVIACCLSACLRVFQRVMAAAGWLLQQVRRSMTAAARTIVNQTCTAVRSLAAMAHCILSYSVDKFRLTIRTLHCYLDPVKRAVTRQLLNAIDYMIRFLYFLGDTIRIVVKALLFRLALLGRIIMRFLRFVGDNIRIAVKSLLYHLDPVRRVLKRLFLHATELVVRFFGFLGDKILLAVKSVQFHLNPQKRGLMGKIFKAIDRTLRVIAHVARRILQSLVSVCTGVWDHVERFLVWLCSLLYVTFVVPSVRVMSTVLKALYILVAAVLSPFFKKYWQLVAAGLAFNGTYLFLLAALAESGSISGQIKFGLGSWSLALIGYTMVRSVVLSTGNLAARRVTVDESALRFMDLYLGYGATCIIRSGWHAISMAFSLFLTITDFLVRKTCKLGWWVLDGSFRSIIQPVLHVFKKVIKMIWNSPYFSMGASIGTVCVAYLLHRSHIAFPYPSISLENLRLTRAAAIASVTVELVLNRLMFLAQLGGHIASSFYDAVYEPVANADTSSPGVALCCWLLSCAVTKTRHRVRVKTFAVPVVVFYVAGVAASSLLKAVSVSTLIWFFLSLFVDNYENQSRARARIAFQEFRSRRKSTPACDVSDTSEACAICLDDFAQYETTVQEISLPCGHHFHDKCIREWFQASPLSKRCPLCRRAVSGWDRVLEVAF